MRDPLNMGAYYASFNKKGEGPRLSYDVRPGLFNTTGLYVGWGTDYEIVTLEELEAKGQL